MKRAIIFALLCLLPLPAVADEPVGACSWVDGRLLLYNGTPSVRIWPRGTHRLLGVVNSSGGSEGPGVLPVSVERLNPSFDRGVWGRFRACPLTKQRRGWMQFVYLTDARDLTARP